MTISERHRDPLAHAATLMKAHRYVEAIAFLRGQLAFGDDMAMEQRLAECRYLAYADQPPQASRAEAWPPATSDVFPGVAGVPEISASELDARTLAAAIRRHGALLVRGLLDPVVADRLAADIQHTIDACQRWHATKRKSRSPWYSRLPLADGCDIMYARPWVEGAGGVLSVDSPRILHALLEIFARSGVVRAIEGYFGETPMLSVGKSTLRCVPSTQKPGDWHQDGAFMGADIRSVNLWLSLSHCGEDASGLEFLPHRLEHVLPTGSHGAYFDWSVGPGMVTEVAEGASTVSPVFRPGDAMLFDHFFLHRTGAPAAISKNRYAVESWFFAPSAYPAQQVPLYL